MWSTDSIRRCAGGCVGGCTLRLEHIRRAPLQRGCAVRRLPLSSPHARGTHDCCAARQGADFPSAAQRRAARARGHDAVGFFRQSRPRPAPGALLGRRHMRSSCAREPAHARLPVLPCACGMPQTRAKHMYPLSARRASELLACCSSLPGRCKSADRQSGLADTPAWSRSYSWCSTLGAASLIARKPWCRRMSSACRRPRACSCPSRTCHKICP